MKYQLFNREIVFSLVAVVMFLGFTAMSYGQAVVSVEPAEIESPAAGEQLMVDINITGGQDVAGYQITVTFDPTALSYVDGSNATYLPGAFAVPNVTTENSVIIAATSLAGAAANADGTLAQVTFEVVEAKASAISLSDVLLSDAEANALDATTTDGAVTVAAAEAPAEAETEAETEAPADAAADAAAETDAPADAATDAAAETEAPADAAAETEAPAEAPAEAETEAPAETESEMPASQMFEITLTNLTTGEAGSGGQVLSPPIFVAHAAGINLATPGEPATPAIVALAETGDVSGLAVLAAAANANAVLAEGPVVPGGSLTVTVTADAVNSSLSVGSMLVSTNDGFIALTDVPLFGEDGTPVETSIDLNAYDAGSEDNNELATHIPGPLGLDAAADPEGSNERMETVGGVITPHPGIQGVGDVSEAFAWTEPTAMLTITPVAAEAPVVEAPVVEEPVVEEPEMPTEHGFDLALEAGLNMISIPLMPEEPYTAKSLADMLGSTIVVKLDATTQSFVGYTVAADDDGFAIDGGRGYIVNTPAGGVVTFTGKAWSNQQTEADAPAEAEAETEAPAETPAEVEAETDAPADAPAEATAETDAPADAVAETEAPADAAADAAAETDAPADAVAETEAPADAPAEATAETEAPAEAAADAAAETDAAAEAAADAAADTDAAAEAAADAAADTEAPAAPARTFRSAWAFVVTSELRGMEAGATYNVVAENLRTGAVTSESVTSDMKRSSAVWADLNRKSVVEAGDKLEITLYDTRGNIVSGPFQRTVSTADIRNAYLNLQLEVGDVKPQDTLLAQNFPNPFNPETWIPYQLNKDAEVKIQIFDTAGRLVRTLDLGWKPTGSYMNPSSAAYWDGRNEVGEGVASGIYFYTLTTEGFAATRKMVILK